METLVDRESYLFRWRRQSKLYVLLLATKNGIKYWVTQTLRINHTLEVDIEVCVHSAALLHRLFKVLQFGIAYIQ